MKLDLKALAIAGAVLWGGGFLLVALGNLMFTDYGAAALAFGASIYPGYNGPDGIGSVIVVGLYAAVDGAVAAAIFGWLYNAVTGKGRASAT